MTWGLLVGRFGTFVRDNCTVEAQAAASTEAVCPEDVEHVRSAVAHHLIPLMLLSKVDGETADSEIAVILDHCVAIARRREVVLADGHRAAFAAYVAGYRPTLMQLDPALRLLERDNLEDLADLFTAASSVISADGRLDPAELRLLDEIKEEATRLAKAA